MDEIVSLLHKYESIVERNKKIEENISSLKSEWDILEKSKQFLINFTEDMRDKIKVKLESLANSGLAAVFTDKKMEFMIVSNKTKQGLKYDLYVATDGTITPLTDAKGGGVLDVITLCLRISFVKLFSGQLRQTIILDEPFKNLDGVRLQNAVTWLAQVSKELDIQFIIITHISDLIDIADKTFAFVLNKDNVTEVVEYKKC